MVADQPIPTVDGLLAATAHVHGLIRATRTTRHIDTLDVEWVNPFEPESSGQARNGRVVCSLTGP